MKRFFIILDTRPKTQREANALIEYYVEQNHIPSCRIITIRHNRHFNVVWKLYEKNLYEKRGKFYVYGDVAEYRKHLDQSTAVVEGWLKRRKK